MSQGTFSDILLRLEAFKIIFVFCPYIHFFVGVIFQIYFFVGVFSPFWFKNDQILKWDFFTSLCPYTFRRVVKFPRKSFLTANNALMKNFLFYPNPDSIYCGLFLCP